VADDVAINTVSGRASFGVAQTGVLAYRTAGGATSISDLVWLDRSGKSIGTVGDGRTYYQIRLSPDGKRVAVAEAAAGSLQFRLSVLDLGNGVASRLTDEKAIANDPAWSPDSETIAYEALQTNGRQMFTHRVGSPTATLVFESTDDPKWLDDWSADGKFLLFHLPRPSKLFAVPLDEPRTAKLLIETPETIDSAHFSPDGKWIAYQITESSVYQVWVASFPAFDKRRRISPQGGGQAFWRGDGRELFYLTPAGKMMSVAVTPNASNGTLDFATPVEMFQSPNATPTLTVDQYTVTKDGKRFLFIRPRDTTVVRPPVTVVVNWTTGMK
jgi:Tol biopolymer transport system component